jgi:adenosylcobyric acid synthase
VNVGCCASAPTLACTLSFASTFGSENRVKAKAMMVVGTSSHAGKSWTATAICRLLRRRGLRVAPFKAQNMSLNSYPCADGGEIGRAQVAQAEACGLEPLADMNPILLKPTAHDASQVIVNGRVWKQLSARDYYTHYEFLLGQVTAAFERLSEKFEFIVMEGAGSASEINLRSRDLVNLPLAARLGTPAMLVADIDRGGVFASVAGTFALLEPGERELLRSFVINRFRGDRAIFADGCATLEQLAGRPCLGVFPYAEDIRLDDEDIVSLEDRAAGTAPANGAVRRDAGHGLRVVIVRLPRISNFTDFRLLPDAEYITEPCPETPDCIILPGTKNTIGDLLWLRQRGLDRWILDCHARGASVWGICGGYQILGRRISDPAGVESGSGSGSVEGLGLLPISTVMLEEKTTRVVNAKCARSGVEFRAYEIHMGDTRTVDQERPAGGANGKGMETGEGKCFAWVDGKPEGWCGEGIAGTYLHGALETPEVLRSRLADVASRRGKEFDASAIRGDSKQRHYDRLADWFEQHVDLPRFEELYLR